MTYCHHVDPLTRVCVLCGHGMLYIRGLGELVVGLDNTPFDPAGEPCCRVLEMPEGELWRQTRPG